jgi:hypothetical protein
LLANHTCYQAREASGEARGEGEEERKKKETKKATSGQQRDEERFKMHLVKILRDRNTTYECFHYSKHLSSSNDKIAEIFLTTAHV